MLAQIPISKIKTGTRGRTDMGDITQLAMAISSEGLISPIAVAENKDGTYELLAGGRRLLACQTLNMTDISANIYPSETSASMRRVIELKENTERSDMNWVEVACMRTEIHRLLLEGHDGRTGKTAEGWGQQETADTLGVSASTMAQDLRLTRAMLDMPEITNCRTRGEALTILDSLGRKAEVIQSVRVREVEKAIAEADFNGDSKALLSSLYKVGDFFKQDLPERYYDIVEIDPPYAVSLNSQTKGMSTETYVKRMLEYNEVKIDNYHEFLTQTFTACKAAMRDDSWLLCWFSANRWEIVYGALCEAGLNTVKTPIIWNKCTSGRTFNPQRLGYAYEPCFYAYKGKPKLAYNGKNILTHILPPTSIRYHPTQRPLPLMEDLLTTFGRKGSNVLVPFAGSGTTMLAAFNCGMSAVGYDLCGAYKESYIKRVMSGDGVRYYDRATDIPYTDDMGIRNSVETPSEQEEE